MRYDFVFETQSGTFDTGQNTLVISLSAPHKRAPTISAITINETNANYNVFVEGVSTTTVQLGISSPAPPDLNVHVHAVSYL